MICRIARVYDHRNKKADGGRGGGRDTRKGGCRRNQRDGRAGVAVAGRVGSLRRGYILRFTLGYLARVLSGRGWIFPRFVRREQERERERDGWLVTVKQKSFIRRTCPPRINYGLVSRDGSKPRISRTFLFHRTDIGLLGKFVRNFVPRVQTRY